MNFPFPSCGVLSGCQLIDADGELYVSGGKAEDGESKTHFHRYDPDENEWEVLPGMEYPKASHSMVQLKQCIYTVSCDGFTERYHLNERHWEDLSFCPGIDGEHSTVAIQDNLVAVDIDADTQSSFKVYNPSTDRWHTQDDTLEPVHNSIRTLTVQNGMCYLVVHTRTENNAIACQVNQLNCNFEDDEAPSVSVGDVVDQSQVPRNSCGAFCINGSVFVKLYGYVHKTDITVNDLQLEEANLRVWNDITQLTTGAAVTNYTFDRHRLHPAYTA